MSRTTNRARIPWQMIVLLLLLLVIPVVLARYVFQSNEQDEPDNKSSSRVKTAIPSENVKNDLAVNSVQQQPGGPLISAHGTIVDFENDVGFGNSRSGWDLSKFSVQGQLKSDGHARIVETPGGHADKIGSRVLRIRGNSEEVEFVPYDKRNVKLDRIQFQAMREKGDSSVVAIEAKSTKRFEKWQEIAILTDQINASGFNPVVIDGEVLSKVANPQKFRFKIGGSKDNGIFVDLLKIDLR